MLTPRLKQILVVLLKREEVIAVKQLADHIGVSKRTVQRELEYIDKSLKPYGITFVSKTGVGVWLEGEAEKRHALLEQIISEDMYDTGNKEERRKRLILEILKDKELKKLFVYSSKFKVSEATISSDLEAIESWINQYDLQIVRKPGSGILVEGTEKSYRRAIRAFVEENINTTLIREIYEPTYDTTATYEIIKRSGIGQMLEEDVMNSVVNSIVKLKNPNIQSLTESSYIGLVIHISIAINRILHDETIEADDSWLKRFESDEDYELAEDIVWALEETFDIEIPELEVAYICLHIKGAKHEHIYWEGKRTLQIENAELTQLLNDMIYAFDSEKAYLLKQDEEFIQGLLAHLQPTLIRLNYDMHIQNPILEGVKRDYEEVFEKCRKAAEVLGAWVNKPIPETEIGFLTVHFGAALVRAEGRQEILRPVRVAVVCSSGIGISRLMSSKLTKIFQERMIVKTYGKRDLSAYEEGKHDFCITSISIDNLEIPKVEVSPLLNDEEIEEIRRMVYKYERVPEKNQYSNGFVDHMEEVHIVATQIKKIIKDMSIHRVPKSMLFDQLLREIGQVLSPHVECQQLIKQNLMEREQISTQIYAEFDFALLHTRTEGITSPCFHIWMTDTLEAFQEPYMKGIHIAFVMLVPIDGYLQTNTEILGNISTMLVENAKFVEAVRNVNEAEVRNILSAQLKKYFALYLSKFTDV
ncbi:MAG: BglG family transcription antiterminator [Eubacteriales bacterium]